MSEAPTPTRHDAPDPLSYAVFRPNSFFIGPFRGWGASYDGRGRLLRRFETVGHGRLEVTARSAVMEQTITFDNGLTDSLRWEIVNDDDGHYVGVEAVRKLRAEGRVHGDGFRWSFPMKLPKWGVVRVCVDHWMVGEDKAVARARASWMGVTLSITNTFYQRDAESA